MKEQTTVSTAKLIEAVLAATPAQQESILNAATSTLDTPKPKLSLKLLKSSEVAAALGLSRVTVFRMRKEGRLPAVETRRGNFLFPESGLQKFVNGAISL